MKMPIIALGRQFGSGGREIGKHLAEKLQVRCYDRELITLAAQKAEVREELFAGKEEKAPNPWLFTGVYEGGPQVRKGQPAEDILFEMQSQVILELAQMGPCIIVGRCADAEEILRHLYRPELGCAGELRFLHQQFCDGDRGDSGTDHHLGQRHLVTRLDLTFAFA